MGYYRASVYRQRGDYYPSRYGRGRGDLFGDVLGAVKSVGNFFGVGGGGTATQPGSTMQFMLPPPQQAGMTIFGKPGGYAAFQTSDGGNKLLPAGQRRDPDQESTYYRPRRMNPLNPRALRRALRRAEGFKKFATRTLKLVGEKRHVAGFKHHKKHKR